jgi:predicted HTH domain antitoxin
MAFRVQYRLKHETPATNGPAPNELTNAPTCATILARGGFDMTTMTFELPETAFSALRLSPPEYLNEMRHAAAATWYELRKISQGKGAELCGVTRAEFLRILSDYRVSILQDDAKSLEMELSG